MTGTTAAEVRAMVAIARASSCEASKAWPGLVKCGTMWRVAKLRARNARATYASTELGWTERLPRSHERTTMRA